MKVGVPQRSRVHLMIKTGCAHVKNWVCPHRSLPLSGPKTGCARAHLAHKVTPPLLNKNTFQESWHVWKFVKEHQSKNSNSKYGKNKLMMRTYTTGKTRDESRVEPEPEKPGKSSKSKTRVILARTRVPELQVRVLVAGFSMDAAILFSH